MQILQTTLNFTVKKIQPEDMKWGGLMTDSSTNESRWNGIVGMLARGTVDICSVTLTATKERAQVGRILVLCKISHIFFTHH